MMMLFPLALGASPESEVLIARGIALIEKNDPLAAMVLHQAASEDPQNPAPYFYLGYFYEKQGDIPGAVSSFEAAIDLDRSNKYFVAYYELGRLYMWMGKYRKASDAFINYFHNIINDPFAEFYLAISRIYLNGAIVKKSFDRSATILPELRDVANFYIALNYLHNGDEVKALKWLNKTLAITDDPEIKLIAKKFKYYLENKGKNYKKIGLTFNAGGGIESDPAREGVTDWTPFSFIDSFAFYLSSPSKSQVGIFQRIYSTYYFSQDYSEFRRLYSATSLTYFRSWIRSRMGMEFSFIDDLADIGEVRELAFNLFGDYNRSILSVFRYGLKAYYLDAGNLIGNSLGAELYMKSLFIFDGGKSNGYVGINYNYSEGSYLSTIGPSFEMMIDKNIVGELYLNGWGELSALNYPKFSEVRSDTRFQSRLYVYYKWLNSLKAGFVWAIDYLTSTDQNYNDRWYGLWLGGTF